MIRIWIQTWFSAAKNQILISWSCLQSRIRSYIPTIRIKLMIPTLWVCPTVDLSLHLHPRAFFVNCCSPSCNPKATGCSPSWKMSSRVKIATVLTSVWDICGGWVRHQLTYSFCFWYVGQMFGRLVGWYCSLLAVHDNWVPTRTSYFDGNKR